MLLRNSRHTNRISRRAAQIAKQYGKERGWKGTRRLKPSLNQEWPGIETTNASHLLFQERGIRPFLMKSLEGKTIPLGKNVFRVAKDVGKPGWVEIEGEQVWRDQKWRHPGIKPTRFMENAIMQAIDENKYLLVKEALARRLKKK